MNIEGCFAFVAMISQDYLDSVYCMGELEYALKLNKPVIALMLQDVDYPQKLSQQRLQFARVDGLAMPEVINKVLNACNQITLGYVQDEFSTDIHPRKHLRPRVPTPKTSTPPPEEDVILSQQVTEVNIHGQIPTRDLMRRYNEEKGRNIRLARDLLDKLAERGDVPIFFDVDEENTELRVAEERFAEEERQRQRMKQIRGEYDDLAHYVVTARPKSAIKAIKRFMEAYPEYGDPQELMKKFRPSSISLMPKPFEWIDIPAGQVTLGKGRDDKAYGVGQTFDVEPFQIAKYPITNAQFRQFIKADGYNQKQWWTEQGWAYRQDKKRTQPRYWDDEKWNGDNHPVVGVSWFEAVAFCLWLSDVTGEKIMLPTEQQWQFVAQGTDGRAYPWGNEWNRDLCNNNVHKKGVGKTTPVTQYEGKGDSPFGVVDMAGNVWEWCLTDYETGNYNVVLNANRRVVRGGSWFDSNSENFRAGNRCRYYPYDGYSSYGFRVSRFN